MRFCQSDGTPLVEDAPIDPYKTMVASQDEIAAALRDSTKEPEKPEPEHEEVLEIPKEEEDPRKTMIASKEEISEILSEEPGMEIPAINEPVPPSPEPPPFIAPPVQETPKPPVESKPFQPEPTPPKTPTPPPSPFDSEPLPDFSKTSPPIPSPFGEPKPPQFIDPKPKESKPLEPAAPIAGAVGGSVNPFDAPKPSAQADQHPAEWQPPAAPEANWQGQGLGKDTPFQPPPVKGPSSVLAIVSVILGLVGLVALLPTILFLFCGILPIGLGLAAIITGFMARSRAKSKPAEYGGGGLAMGGIILGVLSFIAPIAITVLLIVLYGAAMLAMPGVS